MFKNWKQFFYSKYGFNPDRLKQCNECKEHFQEGYIYNNLCAYCEQINVKIDSFINERKWK